MPIHDWTRVNANRFHHFHQDWIVEITRALNRDVLPEGYSAMAEQVTGSPEPDVVTLMSPTRNHGQPPGSTAVADRPLTMRYQTQAEAIRYARKADRIVIYHPDGLVVAVIEIVSPGNKSGTRAITAFADKAAEFLLAGIHLLIVDLFPPTKRDPQGLHKLIWEHIQDDPFEPPPDKPLTLVAYAAALTLRAYVESVAVGDSLPDMPIFLDPEHYILCPLEATYQESWRGFPKALKPALETPPAPS